MKARFQKVIACVIIFAMVVLCVPYDAGAATIKLKNTTAKKTMAIGSTFLIKTNKKNSKLKFSSSKKSVATVSAKGLITAKKKGKTTITIRYGKIKKKLKVTVKKPVGYTISKKSGTYSGVAKVTVKAEKGYCVYYTTSGKFSKAKKIQPKKSKVFQFKKTTTLRLYPVKKSKKMTTSKLNKTKNKNKLRNDYLYTIKKQTSANNADSNVNTDSSSGTTTPSDSQYSGDDSMANYIAPTLTTYDEIDKATEVTEDAIEITIPTEAPSSKIETTTYEISKKNKLTIIAPGTYVIRTESADNAVDGLIEADFPDGTEGTVHMILDGVHLTSSKNTSPDSDTGLITVKKSVTRAVITIRENTVTTLEDTGETGVDKDDSTSVTYTGGIVAKKVPLTINGTGSLNISSVTGNGIKATGSLKIRDAQITVSGANENEPAGHNGITGKTELATYNATLNVYSNEDGLKTTLDEEDIAEDATLATFGNMDLEGGTYEIASANGDAISVYRTLQLNPQKMSVTTNNKAASTDDDSSYKGIKAGTSICIPNTAGTITIDTTATYSSSRVQMDSNDPYADDAIHCNGYVQIDGGTLKIAAGDDGIHSDAGLLFNGGNIKVTESYEALESGDITINNAMIDVTARDDGLNAAGGNDSNSQDDFHKGEDASQTNYQIIINDGSLTVDADGDGIDSNGNIFFKGGTVTVNGSTNGGNGALDYGDHNCVCEVSGGTLVAAGAVGMVAAPTSGSSQPVVNISLSSSQSAGTYVVLKDSSGKTVMTAQPTKTFQSIIMSCEDLKLGESYTIYYGTSTNNLTEETSFTFSSASVSVGESSQGGNGGWNPGGPGRMMKRGMGRRDHWEE